MSILSIDELRYWRRGPFSLNIDPGETICLFGPSGSGKTLMLRAIADLDPHQGRVVLDGVASQEVSAPEWRKKVGLLPAGSQWWYDTVGPHFTSVDANRLASMGFSEEVLDWTVSRLSMGERHRLALLRLLANRPMALLLDEPTANLDPENVSRVEALIETYQAETRAPILWVSHDPGQRGRVAHRIFAFEKEDLVERSPA